MGDYYRMCAVRVFGTELCKCLAKVEDGYVSEGNVVAIRIQDRLVTAEVLHVTYVGKGSSEEAVFTAVEPVYEVERIYHEIWRKSEEEKNDGN